MPTLPVRPRSLRLLLCALAAFLLPAVAGATALGPIVDSFEERSVFADASTSAGERFSAQTNGDGSPGDFGVFNETVSASAPIAGADALAGASQTSELGDDTIAGNGSASAESLVIADDGISDAFGDSLFLFEFTVDSFVDFTITGLLEAAAGLGADALALFELTNLDTTDPLVSLQALPDETTPIDAMGSLMPGTTYQILASATALAGAFGPSGPLDASASWDFSLAVSPSVPEPSTAVLVVLGLAGLAVRSRRSSG